MPEPIPSSRFLLPVDSPLASKLSHELIEHLPVGVCLCDAAGKVVGYNRKASEIWGESPDLAHAAPHISGAWRLLTVDGLHIPHEQSPIAQVLTTQQSVEHYPAIIERRDGSQVPVQVHVVPLFDDTGVMIGFMTSLQDQRQHVAQQVVQQNLEDALFQSQKMEMVGQITSGLAHDFNNQLASMKMAFSLMQGEVEQAPSERLRRFFDLGRQALERATALAENLLQFSRNRPMRLTKIDTCDAIEKIAPLIRSALSKDIGLALDLNPQAWPFEANPQQLESCLLNLALNARDAMPGGGTLTVRTFNAELDRQTVPGHNATFQPGSYTVLSIEDTGVGMDEGTLEKIFAPFFTTKGAGKGTGLGLAMVRGFVTDMNGQLTVSSQPGQGARFDLYFPRYGSDLSMAIKGSEQ